MGGRVSFLHVLVAGAVLMVSVVGGYWASYTAFVPAPVREAVRLVHERGVGRQVALQQVLDRDVKPGQSIDDAARWLQLAGFEDSCRRAPCEPVEDRFLHRYTYDAPILFWPMVVSNSWSILIEIDRDRKIVSAHCSVSVTAGLW